jgi:hypothetical protein
LAMDLELFKRGRGFFPVGFESEKYHSKMEFAEFIVCRMLGIRDVSAFR